MTSQTIFLTLEQVLVIHENQIGLYGGTSGLRDLALLGSAILRPQTTFGGEDLYPTLFEKAAALMHSLVLNHSFLDGNKRTGTVSVLVFLEINGYEIDVSQKQLIKVALGVESKKLDINQLAGWLKKNSKRA